MIPQLQASATITGHGVLEIGGVGQRATNPEFYGGGIVDANGKADYIVWARNFAGIRFHDFTLKGANVAGLVLGDPASSFSDNAWVTNMWIDRGSYRHTHIRQLCLLRNLHGSVNHNNQCKCNVLALSTQAAGVISLATLLPVSSGEPSELDQSCQTKGSSNLTEAGQRISDKAFIVWRITTEVGAWLRKVVLGYYQYHAVPGNSTQLRIFCRRIGWLWRSVLVRRSQRAQVRWDRLSPLLTRWIPQPRILHPYPDARFAATHPQ